MLNVLLASLPIIALIVLMGVMRVSGDRSSMITLGITLVLAVFGFGASLGDTGVAFLFGVVKALVPILFIVVMAIYSYNVLLHTGKIEVLKSQFSLVSDDKSVQVLLITWGFGGLLEGMAGFGTAVAIPAAILMSLGFPAGFSALTSLLANSVATGFGALGVPVTVLGQETSMDPNQLGVAVIEQLAPMMLLIPLALVVLSDPKLSSIGKNVALATVVGAVSFGAQYGAVRYLGAETPAIVGSVAAILVTVLMGKVMARWKKGWGRGRAIVSNTLTGQRFEASGQEKPTKTLGYSAKQVARAWAVYGFIMFFIVLVSPVFGFVRRALSQVLVTTLVFPIGGESKTYTIAWLTQAGVVLFVGTFLGGVVQGARAIDLMKTLWKTVVQLRRTMVTVICLVGLSSVMDTAGMTGAIASGLAVAAGGFYPFVAPGIGALGTFLTGSDTSSNILFGKLQAGVASHIGVDPGWLAASNTAGATGGKIISPQSIAIATSACDQQGQEGSILKRALPYSIVYVIITGIVVYAFGS